MVVVARKPGYTNAAEIRDRKENIHSKPLSRHHTNRHPEITPTVIPADAGIQNWRSEVPGFRPTPMRNRERRKSR